VDERDVRDTGDRYMHHKAEDGVSVACGPVERVTQEESDGE
jgi:hypothetical protein